MSRSNDCEHIISAACGGEYALRLAVEWPVEQFGIERTYYLQCRTVASYIKGYNCCIVGLDFEK